MKDLGIYVPSLSRYSIIHKGPLSQIPKNIHHKVRYVVSEKEQEEYEERLPDGCHVSAIDMTGGIGVVRQWIIRNAVEQFGHKYVLFIDDDTNISYRHEGTKLKKCEPKHFKQMLIEVHKFLKQGYVHVGLSERATNYTVTKPYSEIGKMYNVCAYNAEKLLEENIRFDRMLVMEDYDVTLSLLKRGHPNIILFNYAFEQRKAGDVGGCSTYRTWELQRSAAFQLSAQHPGCVKVTVKKSKEKWEGVGTNRVDVNVNWKKAYRPKGNKDQSIKKFFK